jgi:hypothetical protein
MSEFGPTEVPKGMQDEITAAGKETLDANEKMVLLGRLCTEAFSTPDAMLAQGITEDMKTLARLQLEEMGYDLEDAQMRAINGMSPAQIRVALRLNMEK